MICDIFVIHQAFAPNDMQHGESERRVGSRTHLKVQIGRSGGIGPDRVDYDDFGAMPMQPVGLHMGSAMGWIRTPDQDARAVFCRTGVESGNRIAKYVPQRRVTRGVTDRVRVDLRCTNMGKETIRKISRDG